MSRWTHRRRRQRRRAADVDLRGLIWSVVRRQVPPAQLRLLRLRERWPDLAGPTLAERAHPADLHGGTLVVHVHNDQWRHELEYLKPALLARLGEADRGIHTLVVRRGPFPEPEPEAPPLEPDTPAQRGWFGLEPDPPRETFDALMEVRDPELRNSLAETRVLLGDAGHERKRRT